MERSLKYIKYCLYFYAGFFLIWNGAVLLIYQDMEYEVFRGLSRGIFAAVFVYYMFKTRHKWVYWLNYFFIGFYALIAVLTWPFLIMNLPQEESELYSRMFGLVIMTPIITAPLLVAFYHMSKKEVRAYLTSGKEMNVTPTAEAQN